MKNIYKSTSGFILRILADTRFFIFSLVLFSVHCLWLAFSAYSLPFDEYFHLGIIKFYALQFSPFISHQPAAVSYLGDLTRLPNYLYGYLMSFPYRFFSIFTDNPYTLIVLMRCFNIALVIIGLILWRKFLFKIGVSKRLTQLVLFVFMLLPLVVLVAAELNYDNLAFVLTPVFLSLAFNLVNGKINIKNVVGFISVGLLTCLVKNQFIVIFSLTTALVVLLIFKRIGFRASRQKLLKSIKATSRPIVVTLTILLLLSVGLFTERYGYNFVRFHNITVDCAKVQPFEVCYQYSPWQRDYNTVLTKSSDKLFGNPASYTIHWITAMMRGFVANFANVLNTAKPWDPFGTYEFKPLLPLMIISGYTALIAGLVSLVINFKKWWEINWMRYSILLTGSYTVILLLFNYSSYLRTGQAYAIQPRYLLPLLILILAVAAKLILMLVKNRSLASWLAGIIILIFIYSGGAIGWFLYANPNWYWPNSTNISLNQQIQSKLQSTVFHIDSD